MSAHTSPSPQAVIDNSGARNLEEDTVPTMYHDPLPSEPAPIVTEPTETKRRKPAMAPPHNLPAKGVFSNVLTSKILQQSPPIRGDHPEIQPGTWRDAVPDDFYVQKTSSPTRAAHAVEPPVTLAASPYTGEGDARQALPASPHETRTGDVQETEGTAAVPAALFTEVTPQRPTLPSPSPPRCTAVSGADAQWAVATPSAPAELAEPTHAARPNASASEAPGPSFPPVSTPGTVTPTHISPSKASPRPPRREPHAASPHVMAPDHADAAHAHGDVALTTGAALAPVEEDERGLPSPMRSTEASRRRSISVKEDLVELQQRALSPPKMLFARPQPYFGEPAEVDLAEARSPPRDVGDGSKPKGFDKYEEDGRRKREALEAREEEEARLAAEQLTFKPVISPAAQRKKSAETFDDFLADQAQKQRDMQERARRLSQALAEKEEEARKSRFVNEHSQRLLEKRARRRADALGQAFSGSAQQQATRASGPRLSIVDRLDEVVAMQRENRERLRRESQPTFQPELATRAATATPQKGDEATPLLLSDGHDEPDRERETGGHEKKDKYAYFLSLYDRTVAQKNATRAKLEQMKAQELEEASPKSTRRMTATEAEQLVATIEQREAERKQRWDAKRKQAEAEEAEALHKPKLSTKTEKLAQRAKTRWAVAEERRKAELEEARRRQAERPLYVKTAETRSPAFEQHQCNTSDRRSRRLAQLREQQAEAELRECTFRPRLSPETERIAEHFSFEATALDLDVHEAAPHPAANKSDARDDTEMGMGSVVRSLSRRQSPMHEDPRLRSHDGISPLFDPSRLRLLKEINNEERSASLPAATTHTPAESPVPRMPHATPAGGASVVPTNAQARPRVTASLDSDTSLQSHIQSLEEVLGEWQSLEKELSATPLPRTAHSASR